MAKKKAVKKKAVRRKPKPKPRPVFGFWYPDEDDIEIIIKDFKLDHIIHDECDEGDWYE